MGIEKSVDVAVKEVTDPERPQSQGSLGCTTPKPPRSTFRGWLPEMLVSFLAAGSLVSIGGILLALDQEPVGQLPFKIKLTTAISILSKVTEATVALVLAACLSQIMWMRYSSKSRPINDFAVYDAASRGAKGQAMFLLQRHQGIKAYTGVILALMTLAIGPFYQQTVGYEVLDGVASLPRCFNTNHSTTSDSMYNGLHGALYSDTAQVGTNRDQTLQSLNNDCITGNCTFPVYASLGICGGCVNASSEVKTDCRIRQDRVQGLVWGCTSTLNNNTINNYTDPDVGQVLASMSPNNVSALGLQYGNAVNYDFSSIRYAKGGVVYAANCLFYYCVRGYNSTVLNTFITENITTTYSDPNAAKVLGASIPDFSTGKPIGPFNDTVLSPPQSQWANLGLNQSTKFTVDWYTHKMLKEYLTAAFSGIHYVNYTNSSASSKYIGAKSDDVVVSQIYKNLWGADPRQQNLNTVLSAYAFEMTNSLRSTCQQSEHINGLAKNIAILLDVQWLWLIFPAVLIAGTAGLLAATMIESRQRRFALWKTALLPLLFHGVGLHRSPSSGDGTANPQEVPPEIVAELENIEGMQKHAQGMRVRLERNASGTWFFRRPQEEPPVE